MRDITKQFTSSKSIMAFLITAAMLLSVGLAFLAPTSDAGAITNYRSKTFKTKAQCEQNRSKYPTTAAYAGRCDAIGQKYGNKIVTIGYSHMIYTRY
jgi:hypothetical protein